MLYVGIDPGESHVGFAALEITSDKVVRVEARTYSVEARKGYIGMAYDIMDMLPHAKRTHIVCENFRIRRSGHQSFSAGNTLRLIGALEYGSHLIDAFSFSTIEPSNKMEEETRELFGRVLFNYRQRWTKPRHAAWKHCLSAWRVLGMYMFVNNRDLLLSLRKQKRSHVSQQWLPALRKKGDFVAEAATWNKR